MSTSSSYGQRSGSGHHRSYEQDFRSKSHTDKEKRTSYKHSSSSSSRAPVQEAATRQRSAERESKIPKPAKVIKDAEVTEIFSEEEERSPRSEDESVKSRDR